MMFFRLLFARRKIRKKGTIILSLQIVFRVFLGIIVFEFMRG